MYGSDKYFVYMIIINGFPTFRGNEDDNYINHASFELLKLFNLILTSIKSLENHIVILVTI